MLNGQNIAVLTIATLCRGSVVNINRILCALNTLQLDLLGI